MQKHDDVVQNLNGNVVVNAQVQVLIAGTNTPATVFSDVAGLVQATNLRTDKLGQFAFYAPNGRYDIFLNIGGSRVAHDTDVLLFDPEDDQRITNPSAGSGNSGSSGNGVGTGNRAEVLLTPDSNNIITPDLSLSNRFRFLMTANTTLANPINGDNIQHIYLSGYQDSAGAHTMSYGRAYMLPGSQPFVPPQGANAAFTLELRPTFNLVSNALNWGLIGYPDNKTFSAGLGLATKIAIIGTSEYYMVRDAFGAVVPGQTIQITRNGVSAEVTGTIVGSDASQVFRVYGAPVPANGTDQRPQLYLLQTDYGAGGANRPSYGKALFNFEGQGKVYVRDIRLGGARNIDGDARGICHNADGVSLVLNNVEITNCNNGILTGNQTMVGNTEMYDVLIDKCGVGGPSQDATHSYSTVGFTHSVYFGHNNTTVKMLRVSMTNAVDGDNLKCRSGTLIIDQVLCSGAQSGRELEIPNGGVVMATNCIFWKQNQSGTGNMIMLGGNGGAANTGEGLDTSRPRKYKFVNCLFRSDYILNGRDGMLLCNLDPDVPVEFVDCLFQGPAATSNSDDPNGQAIYAGTKTVNGIRYMPSAPPVYTTTGGPLGPILPVGYQSIAMTPITS